ncbi:MULTISPECIES: YcaO-like family protein [unclassified Sinorhizobium]|uniref:YcaO-like family protein n=1 Tax=unclassified Sinorhizobium TaxID=2613772 RepID=UPI0035242B3B
MEFREAIVSGLHLPLAEHRAAEHADQTFRAILPLARRARITRLADLTGLDRIGLPVAQAVRPGAQSEVTSLGRGFSPTEAAIGAIMESLERFYAESIPPDRVFLATADELGIVAGLFENLVLPDHLNGWRTIRTAWINGVDVLAGSIQPVPLELVHTCYTDPPLAHDGLFLRSTTGLACHRTVYDAFLHGIFECIERDAMARAFATHGFFDRMRIASRGLGGTVDHILSLAGEHGISVGFWCAVSTAEVPVVWCQTIEAGAREPILALPTEGYAAGSTIEIAAKSALLEALATRAGAISGARDDQTTRHYTKRTNVIVEKARSLILEGVSTMPSALTRTRIVSDLGELIDRITSAGLGPILAVSVASDAETGIQCVRTVLPGARPFSILR